MNSPEIKKNQDENTELVSSKKVSCSGPDGPLGHPKVYLCLLYTSPSPRDQRGSRMPSSA